MTTQSNTLYCSEDLQVLQVYEDVVVAVEDIMTFITVQLNEHDVSFALYISFVDF